MTQPTLDGGPATTHIGLWRSVLDGDHIDHQAWLRARARTAPVGDCKCGDKLMPARPSEVAGRTDYLATCRTSCGWEILAPGGRILRRRPRSAQQPNRGG